MLRDLLKNRLIFNIKLKKEKLKNALVLKRLISNFDICIISNQEQLISILFIFISNILPLGPAPPPPKPIRQQSPQVEEAIELESTDVVDEPVPPPQEESRPSTSNGSNKSTSSLIRSDEETGNSPTPPPEGGDEEAPPPPPEEEEAPPPPAEEAPAEEAPAEEAPAEEPPAEEPPVDDQHEMQPPASPEGQGSKISIQPLVPDNEESKV